MHFSVQFLHIYLVLVSHLCYWLHLFFFSWPWFQVKTSHHEPIDTGSLGRYAIMGTLIYPNVLYIWYQSFRISYQASNLHKMDQFSKNNKHTTLILELWRSYGHSAKVILNFVSDEPLCIMSSGSAMIRKSNRPPPGYPCSFYGYLQSTRTKFWFLKFINIAQE